jgi:hypothetical protein
MQSVMREVAQAKRHYSTLPLFAFLRDESLDPRDRLAFVPAMAPFILAFPDLSRCVFRDEASRDPIQALVHERTRADDHRWPLFLEDLTKLGFDRSAPLTQHLRATMKDAHQQGRMLGPRLAQLAYGATPIEKLVIVEALEETGNVFFGLTAGIAARIEAEGGPELRYLGQLRFARDRRAVDEIALDPPQRVRCLDLAFHVFDLFADWSNELHAGARQVLARAAPHIIHSNATLRSAT